MNPNQCWVCGNKTVILYKSKAGFGITKGCKRCKNFWIGTGLGVNSATVKGRVCSDKGIGIPIKLMYRYCKNKRK